MCSASSRASSLTSSERSVARTRATIASSSAVTARPITIAVSAIACTSASLGCLSPVGRIGASPRVSPEAITTSTADCEIRTIPATTRTRSFVSTR